MKIQYREFEGPALIAMGGGGWGVNQTDIFDFFGAITHRGSCDDCRGGGECVGSWVMKIATEKIEPSFLIFSAMIFFTQFPPSIILRICFRFFQPRFSSSSFPPSQSQDPQIRDIASLRVLRLRWGKEEWMTKIAVKK